MGKFPIVPVEASKDMQFHSDFRNIELKSAFMIFIIASVFCFIILYFEYKIYKVLMIIFIGVPLSYFFASDMFFVKSFKIENSNLVLFVSNNKKINILWSDISRVDIELAPEGLPVVSIPLWKVVKLYFHPGYDFTEKGRELGWLRAKTGIMLPPTSMPAEELAALLNRTRLAYGAADISKDASHV